MKFALSIVLIVVVAVGGLIVLSPKAETKTSASAPTLSIQSIKSDTAKGAQFIDVRTPAEYAAGHINGASNLSLQDMQAGTLPAVPKDTQVYVYCHSGNRSSEATTILKSAGFTKVTDLGAITHVESLGGVIVKS
ncbi:MAG: rhodanese-like domain-containing protein [Candidatus Saccharibacteria bacterium]